MAIYRLEPDLEALLAEAKTQLSAKIPGSSADVTQLFGNGFLGAAWKQAESKHQGFVSIPGLSNNYDRGTRNEIIKAALENHLKELTAIFLEIGLSDDLAKKIAKFISDQPIVMRAQA